MLIREEKIGDPFMFHSQDKNEVKMKIMQDILDCLLSDSEKECKHCRKVVTCGFTWQALFTLNSNLYVDGDFNGYT